MEKEVVRASQLEYVKCKHNGYKKVDNNLGGAFWRATFDAMEDSIMVIDNHCRITQANPATSRLLGKPLDQIIGETCWTTVHGTDKSPEECPLKSALSSGKREVTELHVTGKDIWVEVSVDPIMDNQGKKNSVVHIIRDVTTSKTIQERLSAAIYKSSIPTAVGGSDGSIIVFNKALETLIGYEMSEISDVTDWAKKLYPNKKYREFVWKNIMQALDGKRQDCTEFTITCKDGSIKVVDFHTSFFQGGLVIQMVDITDRKKADKILQDSEEKYRAIFEGAVDGIVYADRKARVMDVNPAFTEITGIPRDQVVGKSAFSLAKRFAKPKDIPHLLKAVRLALSGKPVELYELEINNKIVEISTPSLRKEKSGITGVIRDITERKRSQKILQESEEKYRSIFENIVDVYYRADLDGNLLLFSPSGLRLLGYDRVEEMEGKNLVKDFYYHPEDRGVFLQELAKHGRVVNYEVTLSRKDSTSVIGETNSHFVYDQSGKPIAIEGVFRDISDRRKAEEALRNSEKRFREIFENSLIGMYQTTPDGRILMANSSLARMLGYPSVEALVTRNLEQEGFEPDYSRSWFKQRIETDGSIIGLESKWRKNDGTTLFFRESAQVIRDKVGNTLYYQGTIEDITEQRLTEQALHSTEKRLALAVECTGLGLWDQDFQTSRITRNDNWVRMLGYEPHEIGADRKAFYELIHPDDTRHFEESAQAHEDGQTSVFDVEHRMRAKSGQWRWIRNFGRIVERDEQGKPLRAAGVHLDITERKTAELAVKDSEKKYRDLVETSLDMIFRLDLNGGFTFTNLAWSECTGYSLEEARKINGFDLIHPEDVDRTRTRFANVIAGKVVGAVEFRSNTKSGEYRDVLINLSPVFDTDGKVVSVLGAGLDITDRKRAERALRESEKRLIEAQHIAKMGDFTWDVGTGEATWSDALYDLLRYDKSEEIDYAKVNAEIHHPEDLNRVTQWLQSCIASGREELTPNEYRLIRKDGQTIYVRTQGVIKYRGDKQLKIFATLQDITERKLAEEALKESENQLKRAQEVAHVGSWFLDLKTGTLTWSDETYRIFGVPVGKPLIRSDFLVMVHPDDVAYVKESMADAMQGKPYDIEHRIIVGGTVKWVREKAQLEFDTENKPIFGIGTVQDITERKEAERELREYQVKLKAMASEMLKTQERERQRLALGLHDDICQKLVLTKLALESCLHSIPDAQFGASLKMTAETIGETIRLVESLTFELSNPVLREFGFVAAVENYLETEIQNKHGIAFELRADEPLGSFEEDIKTSLFRVVRELLTNVVKHAKAQKVWISVCKNRDEIHVSIRDDGVGFEPARIKGDNSRIMRFGLFSIREQLEHLGGHLIIDSQPGRGTVATVVI